MGHPLTLKLPVGVYRSLVRQAPSTARAPTGWITMTPIWVPSRSYTARTQAATVLLISFQSTFQIILGMRSAFASSK